MENKIELITDKSQNEIIDNIANDSPWNFKILLLLRKIGKKTMCYRWMHEQEAIYNESMDNKLHVAEMLTLAIIGTLTGSSFVTFLTTTDNNGILYIVLSVAQLITLFISAVIKGYRSVEKFENRVTQHIQAASRIREINLDIQYQLSLNIKDRDVDKNFLKTTIKNFNDILLLAPSIRQATKNKYLEESKENDMFNPIITDADGELKIMINDDNVSDPPIDSQSTFQIDRWMRNF